MKRLFISSLALMLVGAGCLPGQTNQPSPTSTNGNNTTTNPSPTTTPGTSTTTSPITTQSGVSSVKIYMVAIEDNGRSGPLIGCGDSVVSVTVKVPTTTAPLSAAIRELLKVKTQDYGLSGLYNSLYQSNLQLASASVVSGTATIKLTGSMALGGVCDDPRFKAQLEQTAKQFSTVKNVELYINGVKWDGSMKG